MFKSAQTSNALLQVGLSKKAFHRVFSLKRLPQKPVKQLIKFVPFVIILVTLGGCYLSIGSVHLGTPSYGITDTDLSDINIQVTPFIPPRALDTLSGWVRVDVNIGQIKFNTDDPAFKCFSSFFPLFFVAEDAYPGVYIGIYNNCFQSGYSRPANGTGAMMASLPLDNMVAVFSVPRDDSLCSSATGQCILPTEVPAPSPTVVVPTPTPTTGPSGTAIDPTAANIITNAQTTSSVDNQCNPADSTSSFQVGQTIYVTFNLNLPSDGYFVARWYEDNNPPAVSPPGPFSMGTPRGCGHYSYNNAGNGIVELYWCTQATCNDEALAAVVDFTIS